MCINNANKHELNYSSVHYGGCILTTLPFTYIYIRILPHLIAMNTYQKIKTHQIIKAIIVPSLS